MKRTILLIAIVAVAGSLSGCSDFHNTGLIKKGYDWINTDKQGGDKP